MLSRRLPAALVCVCLLGALITERADGAVGAPESAALANPSDLPVRAVAGRVERLQYRHAGGYPVTDVYLEPSGESFTILGGLENGVRWVAEEEPQFAVGDRVTIELERSAMGWRPRPKDWDAASRPAWQVFPSAPLPSAMPDVQRITPNSVPAVADADLVVEIQGENFGARQGLGAVLFQGLFEHVPAEVLSWSDTRIRCQVPKPGLYNFPQILTGALKVWTPLGGWSDRLEWEGPRLVIPFQYAGDRYGDEELPIRVLFNPAGFPWTVDVVRGLLERSLASWNEVKGGYARFALEGETQAVGERARDGLNVVSWTDPWPHSASWLAVTWSAFDPETGERLETDVEINSTVAWSITDQPIANHYDMRSVLTHEFGHWLRLGHVLNPKSVMNAFITRSEAVWSLLDGDRMGAAWIYPNYGTVNASPERLAAASPEFVELRVRVTDRLGTPRSGLPPNAVRAELEWEPAHAGGLLPERSRPSGPYFAIRPTDEVGSTEIRIPAPREPGRARVTVLADGNALRDRPTLTFEASDWWDPTLPTVRILGPNPLRTTVLRAEVRLPAPGSRYTARLLDARGRVLFVWDLGRLAAGGNEVRLDLSVAGRLVSGVYFLALDGPAFRKATKFVLLP